MPRIFPCRHRIPPVFPAKKAGDFSPASANLRGFAPPTLVLRLAALEEAGVDIDCALSIEIADEVIVERMGGRRTCTNCGASYHVVSAPPKQEGVCDHCGSELSIRKDDAPETVMARLEVYHRETEPLKAFYAERGKLRSVANQPTIEATTAEIEKALGL